MSCPSAAVSSQILCGDATLRFLSFRSLVCSYTFHASHSSSILISRIGELATSFLFPRSSASPASLAHPGTALWLLILSIVVIVNLHLTPHFQAAYSIFRVLGQVLIFILEDEDGFVVEEVAKRTFRPRRSLVLKLRQAHEVVERLHDGR